MSTKSTINDTNFSSGIKGWGGKENPLPDFRVSYTVLFLTLNILRLSAVTDGSPTNVLETCYTAIIRVNAVRNPKSLIHILPKNCLLLNVLWVNREVGK
jgi:hypothetical protein